MLFDQREQATLPDLEIVCRLGTFNLESLSIHNQLLESSQLTVRKGGLPPPLAKNSNLEFFLTDSLATHRI
jgi:hypothetical protein